MSECVCSDCTSMCVYAWMCMSVFFKSILKMINMCVFCSGVEQRWRRVSNKITHFLTHTHSINILIPFRTKTQPSCLREPSMLKCHWDVPITETFRAPLTTCCFSLTTHFHFGQLPSSHVTKFRTNTVSPKNSSVPQYYTSTVHFH